MMRFLPLLPLALFAGPAHAQLVVANDQATATVLGTIYEIDVGTGVATPIYSSNGAESEAWGMAYDAGSNTLYWNNGSTLYSSPYGNPLVPTNLGTMMFGASSVNFVALSFWNGKLYGTRNIATEAVYEIDPVTLVATQVYLHPTTFDFGGLEHDQTDGKLYGLTDAGGAGLYEIDVAGMTQTFKAGYPAGQTDIDGLAVNNGVAYYITDGPNTVQQFFYVYDIATGTQTGTLPSPFTGSGTFCAGTWVGPTSTGTPYCFGDGTGTFCPCSPVPVPHGTPGHGCPTNIFAGGALASASGTASLMADTLVLTGTDMINGSMIFYQGATQQSGGVGLAFGDGLRCIQPTGIRRFKVKTVVGNMATYPELGDNAISIAGNIMMPGTRNYQGWYRSANPSFCTPDTFNLTNGIEVVWGP